jgi:hypothetical protein
MRGAGANGVLEHDDKLRRMVRAFETELRRLEATSKLEWQALPFDAATAGRLAAEWVYVEEPTLANATSWPVLLAQHAWSRSSSASRLLWSCAFASLCQPIVSQALVMARASTSPSRVRSSRTKRFAACVRMCPPASGASGLTAAVRGAAIRSTQTSPASPQSGHCGHECRNARNGEARQGWVMTAEKAKPIEGRADRLCSCAS